MNLDDKGYELIEQARKALAPDYDSTKNMHTVGAAFRTESGKVFVGVNVYSLHGACAELIALGTAITAGERNLISIVAVAGEQGEEILAHCGNCRQILAYYMQEAEVIVPGPEGHIKRRVKDLLPYAY